MSEEEKRTRRKGIGDGSLINLPPEKIYRESVIPHEFQWVVLQDLNDVLIGNYFSIALLTFSAAFIGAWLSSSDETHKLIGLILLIFGVAMHLILVSRKVYMWKKRAISVGDI